jgi:hypothetical protein
LPLAVGAIPVWLAQLAASALFVLGVYILSAAVKRMKNSGAELPWTKLPPNWSKRTKSQRTFETL